MSKLLVHGLLLALQFCIPTATRADVTTDAVAAAMCPEWGALAETIGAEVEAGKKPAQALVILAYREPAYSSEKIQKKAIAAFRNQIELSCYDRATKP